MFECAYLRKNGKKCNKKVEEGQIACSRHGGSKNDQSGGFLFEMIYPMGASVGAATFALYKLNNIVSTWYIDKYSIKKNKKKNKLIY